MTAGRPVLERVLRRDRILVLAALAVVVLLAWTYLLLGAGMDMGVASMGVDEARWTLHSAGLGFAMWELMMVAMMLPSAAPMLLLFATLSRRGHAGAAALQRTAAFGLAYVAVWTGFAIVATGIQWGLATAMLLSPALAIRSTMASGALFIAAGVYQFLPLKQGCLRHCRAPAEFLARYWRTGTAGAFRMGLRHGVLCLGCCWLLMGLLFVGGVMNLLWIAILALIVFAEKVMSRGLLVGRVLAVGLVAWGVAVLIYGAGLRAEL